MAAALEAAYKGVEAGKLADHPKQAALQKTLTGIHTLHPVRFWFACQSPLYRMQHHPVVPSAAVSLM